MASITELLASRNQSLERAVLAGILGSRKIPPQVMPEYFDGAEYRLFRALYDQWNKHGDIEPKLLMREHPVMSDILEASPVMSDTAYSELHGHWIRRATGQSIATLNGNEPDMMIRKLQAEIGSIAMRRSDDKYIHTENLKLLLDSLEKSAISKKNIIGYPVNLDDFDRDLNGFEKGKFYVLGALKKSGKSRFMLYCAIQLCEQGCGVLMDSLEMNAVQLNSLALAYYSGIDSSRLGTMMPKEDYDRLSIAFSKAAELNWSIYRDYTTAELKSRIQYERQSRKIDIVFVDFIQRMRNDKYRRDRVREVESVAQDLANISRDEDVCVIALSQLSGKAEYLEDDEIPDMKYLKESQAIAENADAIIMMHNVDRNSNPYNEPNSYRLPTIKFRTEQRYGVSGATCRCLADLRTCRFKPDGGGSFD